MIANAAAAIENHKQEVNDLNVFPVPDGDTGTNLSLTIGAADKALSEITPKTAGHAVEVMASAMLRGARGNSGVILSLLFRGFSKALKDLSTCDADAFAQALANGVDSAYKAVMKPAEGTMLTVSRMASVAAVSAAETETDVEVVLEKALDAGYIALAETVNQNPVLQKAGVIDAGAKGYLYMLDGMLKAMRGIVIGKSESGESLQGKADFAQFEHEDITFTYCTEFMIERTTEKDPNLLRAYLDARGDSIVVVDDDSIIKVHVHTDEPGNALTQGLTYGSLVSIKIENMREQHAQAVSAASELPKQAEPEEMKDYAVVAVCAGAGIEEVFSDLGADRVITGGQTMNPSTEDILEKINNAPSEVVFVLPNNKNIIMAAQQCIKLTSKQAIVIPTRSIPQGISAMLALGVCEGIEEMAQAMTDAAKRVKTALVTTSARDSNFDGLEIKKDEHLALFEDQLSAHGADAEKVFDVIVKTICESSPEFITIFTGEGADQAETELLESKISTAAQGVEVSIIYGGQPVYQYIISAE